MKAYKIFLPLTLLLSALLPVRAAAGTELKDLRVEHRREPLDIEETHPSFSWKMESSEKGQKQLAYRIRVRRESDGRQVWDSGEVNDSLSTGIRYLGVALQPGMGYEWDLTVTDKDGKSHDASSRFETGLMDPRLSAWQGARWIGDTRPVLDAASLRRFSISSDFIIVKGKTAGFILGADDFRLKDVFQNSWNLAGENYYKVILDFSGYGTAAGSELRVYRVGYAPDDSPSRTLLTVGKGSNLDRILKGAPSDEHSLKLSVCDGSFAFEVDGQPLSSGVGETRFPVSPSGTYPCLCSVGFAAGPGSDVTYTGYRIEAGGRPLFEGATQYRRFEALSCIRLPRYRNQNAYENDVVVINKADKEIIEYLDPSYGGGKLLRSEFTTAAGKTLRKAKLYVSALGVCDFYLNGKKVGDDWFTPGASLYCERVTYRAYDVTPLLRSGRNAIGAELFEGWYDGPTQALLCRLDLSYGDGTTERIVSLPDTWKSFDDGREAAVKGWNEPGFDDSRWRAAETVGADGDSYPYLSARTDEPIRVRETLGAVERITAHSEDYRTHIYDMGVSMTGVPELHIPAGWLKQGDAVIIRYASRLHPDDAGPSLAGHLLYEDGPGAAGADVFVATGDGKTVIRPRATYHSYRYIQVTLPSHEGPLPLENVKGLVLSSCEVPTGTYQAVTVDGETGEWAGQLFEETQRCQLDDCFTVPDDPLSMIGTGDAQAYSLNASYNADVYGFFRQWMTALRDGRAGNGEVPGPAAVCTVPWQMYRQYGDTRIVEENLETMMDWLNANAFPPAGGTPTDAAYHSLLEAGAEMAAAVGRSDYARALRERSRLAGKDDASPALTPDALPALSRAGRWAEAYDVFASMDDDDATAPGPVGQWMYEYQLGITPGEEAGYKHFVLQPVAGGDFRSLTGSFESEYGRICSAWLSDGAGGMTAYTAEVPANSSATLYLPIKEGELEFGGNEWARYCGTELHNGILTAVYELASGRHAFLIGDTQITVE